VDTDGKRFLLGVTEHGINVLHAGDAPTPAEALPTDTAEAPLLLPLGPGGELPTRRSIRQASFEAELAKRRRSPAVLTNPVNGSVLDPGTWRLAAGALRSGWRP
jgi:flagellar protein FliO/FliZ